MSRGRRGTAHAPDGTRARADDLRVGSRDRKFVSNDVHGFVITQGTDTIEEPAYLLDLVLAGDAPIVVTGQPGGARRGCLVVFADDAYAARHGVPIVIAARRRCRARVADQPSVRSRRFESNVVVRPCRMIDRVQCFARWTPLNRPR